MALNFHRKQKIIFSLQFHFFAPSRKTKQNSYGCGVIMCLSYCFIVMKGKCSQCRLPLKNDCAILCVWRSILNECNKSFTRMGLDAVITMKGTVSASYPITSIFKEARTMSLIRTNAIFCSVRCLKTWC